MEVGKNVFRQRVQILAETRVDYSAPDPRRKLDHRSFGARFRVPARQSDRTGYRSHSGDNPGYRRNPRLGRLVLLLAAEETYFDLTFRLLRTKRPDLPSGLFVFRQARKKLKKYYFNFGRASCVAIKTRAGVSLMPPSIHSSSGPNTAPPYSRAR